MGNRKKIVFEMKVNGRKAKCWRANVLEYSNCEISAGLVEGVEPDNYYMRFDKDGMKPTTWFMTQDEATAVIHVLSSAIWSSLVFKRK